MQVPLHTLHTAAWNWPQPERVWPERWTSTDAAGAPKNGAGTDGLNSAFLPWGAACPSSRVSEVQVGGPMIEYICSDINVFALHP